MSYQYQFVTAEADDIDLNRVLAENPEQDVILITIEGNGRTGLLLLRAEFLSRFVSDDNVRLGVHALYPKFATDRAGFKASQHFQAEPHRDSQQLPLEGGHRAEIVRLDDLPRLKRQLAQARQFKRRFTAKIHYL